MGQITADLNQLKKGMKVRSNTATVLGFLSVGIVYPTPLRDDQLVETQLGQAEGKSNDGFHAALSPFFARGSEVCEFLRVNLPHSCVFSPSLLYAQFRI